MSEWREIDVNWMGMKYVAMTYIANQSADVLTNCLNRGNNVLKAKVTPHPWANNFQVQRHLSISVMEYIPHNLNNMLSNLRGIQR